MYFQERADVVGTRQIHFCAACMHYFCLRVWMAAFSEEPGMTEGDAKYCCDWVDLSWLGKAPTALQLRGHSLSVGFFSSGDLFFFYLSSVYLHYCGLRLPYPQSLVLAICLSVGWLDTSSGDGRELWRSWTRFTSLHVVWGCDGCSSPLTRWMISSLTSAYLGFWVFL